MTQEDKELLFKDLCARLPYGVQCKINYTFSNETTFGENVAAEEDDALVKIDAQSQSAYFNWLGDWLSIEDIKPYLRPLSSMTEEEDKEWQIYKNNIAESCDVRLKERISELHDWFNCHHFDIHHLIEKGLALEAPNDMYKAE